MDEENQKQKVPKTSSSLHPPTAEHKSTRSSTGKTRVNRAPVSQKGTRNFFYSFENRAPPTENDNKSQNSEYLAIDHDIVSELTAAGTPITSRDVTTPVIQLLRKNSSPNCISFWRRICRRATTPTHH